MKADELFIDLKNLPNVLSHEEFYSLYDKMNNGDKDAREELILHNIGLVLYEVCNKFKNVDYDKKDLVSIGNIGLIKAVSTYDNTKDVKFSVYAIRCIDNEIFCFLKKIKKDKILVSLDNDNINDDDYKQGLIDTLSDDSDFTEEYINKEISKVIKNLVNKLPCREKEIIKLYYGFYNNVRYNAKEIAIKFKISDKYVFKIINKIIKGIGSNLKEQGLIETTKFDTIKVNLIDDKRVLKKSIRD